MCGQASRSRATLSCNSSYFSYWQGTIQASYAVMRQRLLIGCSSFLQVMRTTIKAWMSLNLGRILLLTSELAALERLKKRHIILLAL